MAGKNHHLLLGLVVAMLAASCQGLYFGTMGAFGVDKRDILLGRMEAAQDAMQVAHVRFDESVAAYGRVLDDEAGNLEDNFEDLSIAQRRCDSAYRVLNQAVLDVQEVATLVFDEWKEDTGGIVDPNLRKASLANYDKATTKYEKTLRAFRRVQAGMDPVLTSLADHVLFLKLNLHPQALSTLQDNEEELMTQVGALSEVIDRALASGADFIDAMTF